MKHNPNKHISNAQLRLLMEPAYGLFDENHTWWRVRFLHDRAYFVLFTGLETVQTIYSLTLEQALNFLFLAEFTFARICSHAPSYSHAIEDFPTILSYTFSDIHKRVCGLRSVLRNFVDPEQYDYFFNLFKIY